MAAEEIVKLKVTTEGDQAALQNLTKLDRLIAKINGQKINISFSQGMNEAATAAEAREKSYQEAQKTQQAIEKTAQAEARQATADSQEKLKESYSKIGAIILRSVTQNIQKATKELKAMNAEMVSIQKVTGATDAEMERLKDNAFEVAGALGSTPSD